MSDDLVVISRRGAKHLAELIGHDESTADKVRAIFANALAMQRRALATRVRDEAYGLLRGDVDVKGDDTYEGGLLRAARLVEGGQRREDQAPTLVRAVRRLHMVVGGPRGDECAHCTELAGSSVAAPCETLQALGVSK